MTSFRFLLSSFVLLFTISSLASKPAPAYGPTERKKLLDQIVENVKTRDHVLAMVQKSGAKKESFDIINQDLQKRLPAGLELPAMKMKGNRLIVGDHDTGIQVFASEPLQVKFRGQMWTLDKTKTIDVNYLSLVSFLENKKPAAFYQSLLLPQAEAFFSFDTTWNGAIAGGLLGMIGGALIGWGTGGSILWPAVVGGGIGAALGGVVGYTNEAYPLSNKTGTP